MSTYTAQQKIDLVEAFTAAKQYLWDGRSDKLTSSYICGALNRVVLYGELEYFKADIAQKLIEYQLGGHCSVNDYLYYNGYTKTLQSTPETQAFRLAWLDSLIAEFGV